MIKSKFRDLLQLPKPEVTLRYHPMGLVEFDVLGQPRPKRTGRAGLFKRGNKTTPTLQKNPLNEKAEIQIREVFFSWYAEAPQSLKTLLESPWEGPFVYAHQYFFNMTKEEKKKYKGHDIAPKLGKPDIDNLHKMTNDALEGYVFANDSLGVSGYGEKFSVRDGHEYTRVRILLLEELL